MKIRAPNANLGTSRNALKDLKNVEEQIKDMSVLPDFGYAEDNYLLQKNQGESKWKLLTGLLGDPKRFSRLMNFISLQKLEAQVKHHEDQEVMIKKKAAQKSPRATLL